VRTSFGRIMGGMQSIPFFGGHFNLYWPLVGVIFAITSECLFYMSSSNF
jgi:hypothetical protein